MLIIKDKYSLPKVYCDFWPGNKDKDNAVNFIISNDDYSSIQMGISIRGESSTLSTGYPCLFVLMADLNKVMYNATGPNLFTVILHSGSVTKYGRLSKQRHMFNKLLRDQNLPNRQWC